MALPFQTFEPTGDPLVDFENYFRVPLGPYVSPEEWFEKNPHVLSHLPAKIIRESVDFLVPERAPTVTGIYFLIHQNKIAYVGKGFNVYERLDCHFWQKGKRFEKYWCFGGIPYDWLNHAEGYYINVCKPHWNIATVPYNRTLDAIAKKHRDTWVMNERFETGELT